MELYNMDWSIQDQPYKETITKLEGLEASIIKEKQMQKRMAALKANEGGGNSSKKRKIYNGGSSRDNDVTVHTAANVIGEMTDLLPPSDHCKYHPKHHCL
jgi:hypothetical protein